MAAAPTLVAGAAGLYGDDTTGSDDESLNPSYGAGFQLVIPPAQRMLASLESAHGNSDSHGIYLRWGHAG